LLAAATAATNNSTNSTLLPTARYMSCHVCNHPANGNGCKKEILASSPATPEE